MLIKGFFEITIGLEALSKLNLSINYKLIIASMFLAFGIMVFDWSMFKEPVQSFFSTA